MTEREWLEIKTIYLNFERHTEHSKNELIRGQVKRLGIFVMDSMPEGVRK